MAFLKRNRGGSGGLGRGVAVVEHDGGEGPAGAEEFGGPDYGDPIPARPRKRTKLGKPKKVDHANEELQARLSYRVLVEALPGFTKQDAIENARGYAITLTQNASNCYFYVQKIDDGYMVEVQEGVGYAYLPSAIKLATANPGRTVVIPMLNRFMTVHFAARTGRFDVEILPEGKDPESMGSQSPLYAERGPAMEPVTKQEREWLITGAVTAAVGTISLVAALAVYALDPATQIPPEWNTTSAAQLPIMQWSTLMEGDGTSYVVRLEFEDGQWRTVRQSADAMVEIEPVAPAPGGTITPEMPQPAAPIGTPPPPMPAQPQ